MTWAAFHDLMLDQWKVVDRVEDEFIVIPAPGMAGDHLAPATDHHLMDIGPDPDILMGVSDRPRVVVGLVAHERLRRDAAGRLLAGIKRGRRGRAHRGKAALQSFANRLTLAAQDSMLALASRLLQPEVERFPGRELRHRHREAAP